MEQKNKELGKLFIGGVEYECIFNIDNIDDLLKLDSKTRAAIDNSDGGERARHE